MATPEAKSSQETKLRASEWGAFLLRNNSGAFKNESGRLVYYGLGNISQKRNKVIKSSDEIGYTAVTITPEMVGKTVPVFTALEIKTPDFGISAHYPEGSREAAQLKFINSIKHKNGIAGFVRHAQDVDKLFQEYLHWLTN